MEGAISGVFSLFFFFKLIYVCEVWAKTKLYFQKGLYTDLGLDAQSFWLYHVHFYQLT